MEIMVGDGISVDSQSMLTGRCCIIGQSGSGKSYLVGVIIEELSKNRLPYVVIDTEGEYSTLKAAFQVLLVGGEKGDLPIDVDYQRLVEKSIANRTPVVFDVSEELDKEARVNEFLAELYKVEDRLRSPYLVIIEEADKFAPQVVGKERSMVDELSVRGRKRGIGLIVATQRPANINKNVLAQCSYGFIGKLTIENDLSAVNILFDDKSKLASLPSLKTGEFLSFGLDNSARFHAKKRMVKHGGATPILNGSAAENEDVDTLIGELKNFREKAPAKEDAAHKKNGREYIVIKEKVTMDFAKEFAYRIEKKRFIVFGDPAETLESITEKYLPLSLVRLSTRTKRKSEYVEQYVMLDSKLCPVVFDKRIWKDDPLVKKRIKLDEDDVILMSKLDGKKMTIDSIVKQTSIQRKKVSDILKRLESAGLLSRNKNRIGLTDKKRYLMYNELNAESRTVAMDDMIERHAKHAEVKRVVETAFPRSRVDSIADIYLPVYEIRLRMKNRVRSFKIDSIYGKEFG